MSENEKGILTVRNLEIGYGKPPHHCSLVPPVNASAGKGELVAVIGRNGIGKSTFLRTITGLQNPLGGEILINGLPLTSYSNKTLAHNIGYISTEPVRVENMTVFDLVALGRYPHTGWTGSLNIADREAIEFSILNAGIGKLRGRNINELSDGERQRAMIARVLAQDTSIVVMDEPTAFLDIRSRYEMIHLLQELTRIEKKTIIFSTHDFIVAAGESDKIWMFLDDRFVEGAPEDLILGNEISGLFGDSVVSFNADEGVFTFSKPYRGVVSVAGSGTDLKWTVKALNRAGYAINNSDTEIFVKVSDNQGIRKWSVTTPTGSGNFYAIYELVKWLNSK
jgi:iron complex transport system ATP-binding protein